MKINKFHGYVESGLIPFLAILAIVGVGELLVMTLVVSRIPNPVARDIMDAVILVILITAPLYFLVYRPMQRSRRKADFALEELNQRMKDLTRTDDAIESAIRATSPTSGEHFFECLVEELAKALDVRHVLVSELLPGKPERLRSLAFWSDGRLLDNIEYQLAGTPCENVVGKSFCIYPRNVQELFPEDQDLKLLHAESYIGIPLFASSGDAIGNLVALNDRELSEERYSKSLFTIVASRASAEMERLQITRALKQSERELLTVYDNSPIMMFLLDEDRRVLRANLSAQKFLGISQQQALNMRFESLIGCGDSINLNGTRACGDTPHCKTCVIGKHFKESSEIGKQISGIEVRSETRANNKAPLAILDVSVVPLEAGERRLLLVCAEDVTQKREEENQRRLAREDLERAERLRSLATMAGGIAHDLNNMIGPLVGYSELLLESLPPDSPYLSKVRKIHDSASEITLTVQDLLALARRGRYEMTETQLNGVVARFFSSVTAEMILRKHNQVKLSLNLGEGIPSITGSESHLAKIILNLFSNACDAMPNGGALTVTTSMRFINKLPSGYDKVEAGEYVVVGVRDSGIGIAPEDIQRIFDPFFSRKVMSSSGSGLGLAVVYGVVKDHRGYYDVESVLGSGTEFSIYFPVRVSSITDPSAQVMAGPKALALL